MDLFVNALIPSFNFLFRLIWILKIHIHMPTNSSMFVCFGYEEKNKNMYGLIISLLQFFIDYMKRRLKKTLRLILVALMVKDYIFGSFCEYSHAKYHFLFILFFLVLRFWFVSWRFTATCQLMPNSNIFHFPINKYFW